ncbi:hypothetical protein [Agrobacterium pusense]|jgi:hypothetical protein|uniref:hypothetical protein n=1 Tax=Agrobacterium pusense TaxID=648995 RepID=UPI0010BF25F1|nr:hypothetical protein [Agrobacterium pusense]QCM13773.1 hypothetical protein CFBP6625_25575 [Agrobacterium tumefaciens]UXT93289.1 hypothetical protein FY130_26130 [Agrobacterium pusense]
MVRPKITLDDIPVAKPRVQRVETTVPLPEPEPAAVTEINGADSGVAEAVSETLPARPVEPAITSPKADAPKTPATKTQNERGGLRALKALRPQKGDYVLSVSLEERLRDRLARASFESKVKQTNIVREALDEFLRKEGY